VKVVETIADVRAETDATRAAGGSVGFVPTRQKNLSLGNPSSGMTVASHPSGTWVRVEPSGVRYWYMRAGPKMSAPARPVRSRSFSRAPNPMANSMPPCGVA